MKEAGKLYLSNDKHLKTNKSLFKNTTKLENNTFKITIIINSVLKVIVKVNNK